MLFEAVAKDPPQLFACSSSLLAVMLTYTAALRGFLAVTLHAALVQSSATEPKEREVMENVTNACAALASPATKHTQKNSRT
jgi:hypothetical protein